MCNFTQIFAFTVCWYLFTITTYGTMVPSGLFLPGMIIGCGLGEMYSKIILNMGFIDDAHYKIYRVIYIILGMAAMLASYTRMTYSLAVIVMETSLAINIFLPTIVTISVANFTGQFFTRGLYDRAVRAKQMPILKKAVPRVNSKIRAEEIMNTATVSLRSVDTVKNIFTALKTSHHGFPVLNSKN
jgi:chloride channel 6